MSSRRCLIGLGPRQRCRGGNRAVAESLGAQPAGSGHGEGWGGMQSAVAAGQWLWPHCAPAPWPSSPHTAQGRGCGRGQEQLCYRERPLQRWQPWDFSCTSPPSPCHCPCPGAVQRCRGDPHSVHTRGCGTEAGPTCGIGRGLSPPGCAGMGTGAIWAGGLLPGDRFPLILQ